MNAIILVNYSHKAKIVPTIRSSITKDDEVNVEIDNDYDYEGKAAEEKKFFSFFELTTACFPIGDYANLSR